MGVAIVSGLDESFENSRPFVSTSSNEPVAGESETVNEAEPSLEEAIEKIPAEHRRLLEELFGARFTSVRRINPDQLR